MKAFTYCPFCGGDLQLEITNNQNIEYTAKVIYQACKCVYTSDEIDELIDEILEKI